MYVRLLFGSFNVILMIAVPCIKGQIIEVCIPDWCLMKSIPNVLFPLAKNFYLLSGNEYSCEIMIIEVWGPLLHATDLYLNNEYITCFAVSRVWLYIVSAWQSYCFYCLFLQWFWCYYFHHLFLQLFSMEF